MKLLAAITAVPVAATGIAAGEWLYLVYVVGVLYALFWWRPSWLAIPLPAMGVSASADSASRLRAARVWRAVLVPAGAVLLLIVGSAYVDVITRGAGLRDAVLLTLAAFGLVVAALLAHRRVEELTS